MSALHRIQFPPRDARELDQDQTSFYLWQEGQRREIRLHDYDQIFDVPGLYEQVVYDRLKCQSPTVVIDVLRDTVRQSKRELNALRVLDLGAGNGMVGEEIKRHGVARLVGVDILPEARTAAERDRPGVYDDYQIVDFLDLSDAEREGLSVWGLDTLVCVAALGFGDIPARAFLEAYNTIAADGWVAFNIKETFLDRSDTSGFSQLIRELIFSEYLDLYQLRRYRHRYSIEGEPLYYYALGARKAADVPMRFAEELEGVG